MGVEARIDELASRCRRLGESYDVGERRRKG